LALNYLHFKRAPSENQLFMSVAYRLLSSPGMSQLEVLRDTTGMQGFDYPTLEEIVTLWRSYQATGGLQPEEAWDAIAASLALDMAFSGHVRGKYSEH
jgi:hypothetical protein